MNVANRPADRRDRLSFLFLMGYRGTGKTTVGQILAPRLKLALVDTDQEIQDTHRRTIREIFEEEGEDGFRAMETEAIRRVTSGNLAWCRWVGVVFFARRIERGFARLDGSSGCKPRSTRSILEFPATCKLRHSAQPSRTFPVMTKLPNW